MVAFSGFYESHKPRPYGNAHGIVPPHYDGHKKGQERFGASLGGQKTLKRNIFKSFLMSNL